MDFWLLLVGFGLLYWSWLPDDFQSPLSKFTCALYFSVVLGTVGEFGQVDVRTGWGMFFTALEIFLALIFLVIIIAQALDLIGPPKKMEE
jgi:hypothetical protein